MSQTYSHSISMIYKRTPPAPELNHLIDCYWLIDSEGDSTIDQQKIVPDGYPEIILHYKDEYRINISGEWKTQVKQLLAGQLKNHFHLQNTGHSGMLGIKFKPAAIHYFWGINMQPLTGTVIPLPPEISQELAVHIDGANHFEETLTLLNGLFLEKKEHIQPNKKVDLAIDLLFKQKGLIQTNELATQTQLSERQLERLFNKYIGLAPKFYARIIRFSAIFELMQQGDKNWADLVFESGFYDQSHFIKNFKEFTGEDPSAYGFDELNMANFHMKK